MADSTDVLVVAPSPVVRRGLAQTAAETPTLRVVAAVASVRAALAILRARSVHVAVLDHGLRAVTGVDPVRLLQRSFPDLGIVLVAADADRVHDAPVQVVGLDADTEVLARALVDAAGTSGAAPGTVAVGARSPIGDPVLDGLKPIERRVLELLADGLSNREIASLVGLSERMVKKYLSSVFDTLGVSRRTEAAVVYTTRRSGGGAERHTAGVGAPDGAAVVAFPPTVAELAADLEEKRVIAEELQQQLAVADRELARLREEHERYRAVYEDLPVPHLITDAYGIVRAADRAMASLLGLSAESLRGKALASLVPEPGRRAFRQRLGRLARGEDADPPADVAARTFELGDGPVRVVATVGAGDGERYLHWTVAASTPPRPPAADDA